MNHCWLNCDWKKLFYRGNKSNILSLFICHSICAQGLGKYGVLFYNALLIVVPTLLASAFTGDLHKVQTIPLSCIQSQTFFYCYMTMWPLCVFFRLSHLRTGAALHLFYVSFCRASWGTLQQPDSTYSVAMSPLTNLINLKTFLFFPSDLYWCTQ